MRPQTTLALLAVAACHGQSAGILTTLTGTQWSFPTGKIEARQAPLGRVEGIALHPDGSVYLADPDNHLVLRYDRQTGLIERVAGGITGFCGDGGPAVHACLSSPMAVAIDLQGQIYVADYGNNRIRLIDTEGKISTVLFQAAPPLLPTQLALDRQGRLLIASASGDPKLIRTSNDKPKLLRLDRGQVETLAGNGTVRVSPDGAVAANASVGHIADIALDSMDMIYFLEGGVDNGVTPGRLRRITASGQLETLAGGVGRNLPRNGQVAKTESMLQARGLAIDKEDRPVILDLGLIYRVERNGLIRQVVGTGTWTFSQPNGEVEARVAVLDANYASIVVEPDGSYLWGDQHLSTLSGNVVRVFAGNENFRRNALPTAVSAAVLRGSKDIALGVSGELFVADGHDIYKITPEGVLAPLVQRRSVQREPRRVGEQLPLAELFINPNSIAVTRSGDLFFANPRGGLYQLLSNGNAQLVSSLGFTSHLREGPDGSLYFPSRTATSLLRFDRRSGNATTVAGTNESAPSEDGVPISFARFRFIYGITFNTAGETILSDADANRIWRLTKDGRLAAIGGTGSSTRAEVLGNGQLATRSAIPIPLGIFQEDNGALLVTYQFGLLRILPNGTIEHLIGPGNGSSGDGRLPKDGLLSGPNSVVKDGLGNIYISDERNRNIRVIVATPPSGSVSPKSIELTAPAGSTLSSKIQSLAFASKSMHRPPGCPLGFDSARDRLSLRCVSPYRRTPES